MASECRSSSVTALFASLVATSPIPVSLAVGSDRFKYFNNTIVHRTWSGRGLPFTKNA